jgi:hypothetical protein
MHERRNTANRGKTRRDEGEESEHEENMERTRRVAQLRKR